jgi:ABC-type antimicrobial peptide transport system permease subunit
MSQQSERMLQVVVRSRLTTEQTRNAITAAVRELDPNQPLAAFGSLENALQEKSASRRFVTLLLSLFAVTAVAISGVGIYGLITYLVAQRQREFGMRVALGARPGAVARLVLRQVVVMAIAGLCAGAIGAWSFSRALETLLFGIHRLDPVSYVAGALAVMLTCIVAAIVPTIAAIRVDPIIALRT